MLNNRQKRRAKALGFQFLGIPPKGELYTTR